MASKDPLKTALKLSLIGGVALGGFYLAAQRASARKMPEQHIVENVNKDRLLGTWYEIARIPNLFQGDDQVAGTDNYYPKANGDMEVIYKYKEKSFDGPEKQMKGKLFQEPQYASTGRFKVQFFWPFNADYWIIDLDENYDYMAIGYPDRSMLWIMSRRPEMQPDVYGALLERLKAQQYDVSRLMKIPQPDNAPVMGPPKTATPTKSGN